MNPDGRPVADRTGERYGKLVVVERGERKGGLWHWICRCDCGRMTTVRVNALTTGNTTSCGCARPGGASAAPRRPAIATTPTDRLRLLRARARALDLERLADRIDDDEYL